MKTRLILVLDEHTWSWFPTVNTWRNDFRNFGMGNHYAITIKWLNKSIGINFETKDDGTLKRR
jgi:hypothetical protein